MSETHVESLDPEEFILWMPPEDMTMTTGEQTEIAIPHIPLPILMKDGQGSSPSEKAIGDGIYEYLCRFPFCAHADQYAFILKEAFPFLISDVGSQLILLDMKEVGPEGMIKKIALLKILHHLEPDNFGVIHKIGAANFDLGLNYDELPRVKHYLKEARTWLEQARRKNADDAGNLNLLGHVCYIVGGYHQSKLYWKKAVELLDESENKQDLRERLAKLDAGQFPNQPLVDSLEQIAAVIECINAEEYAQARELMESLEAVGDLPREMPNPEFFYLLGLSREKCEDFSGAYEGFSMALELDKNHQGSQDGLVRMTTEM